MLTLRQCYDSDFDYAFRIHVKIDGLPREVKLSILYDFSSCSSFFICYVPGIGNALQDYIGILKNIAEDLTKNKGSIKFGDQITFPFPDKFYGDINVENSDPIDVSVRFFGDPTWTSIKEIRLTKRLFIYSETELSEQNVLSLKKEGYRIGCNIQFRSNQYSTARTNLQSPLAFICHDSRDKDRVARKIATKLLMMMCPVWYDEFSLRVGSNLRESIEKGLKECKKCILVISPNFLSNNGWTKKEFDSIFTREILEKRGIILPIWYNVTDKDVYEYSPSLLNVTGLDWNKFGENEICNRLRKEILSN